MDNVQFTLKEARIRKGYTQPEAARRIGISQDTLSLYERGKTYPTVPVLKKIEEVYGVGYHDLIFLDC